MQPFALACLALLSGPVVSACGLSQEEQAVASPVEPSLRIERAFPAQEFADPLFMTFADQSGRLFVTEKKGVIRVFDSKQPEKPSSVFLDLSDQVTNKGNEEGLLGLAFHPNYAENGQFFVHYSHAIDDKTGYVSRFEVSEDDPNRADPSSEMVVLKQPQPWRNHNGGMIGFGPDGFLYISFGDGGAGGDPKKSGQNIKTWLGAILRIDVDRPSEGKNYGIPADNPFVNERYAAPEIYAFGLRNVWRFSWDRETGDFWAADVGQNLWEEIDIIQKGGNYGWNTYEGFSKFRGGTQLAHSEHIPPIAVYGRREGISVTGGYVYRGKAFPELHGDYIYGDYATGNLWRLSQDEQGKWRNVIALKRCGQTINSFAEDADGELYLLSHQGGIYQVMPLASETEDAEAQEESQ